MTRHDPGADESLRARARARLQASREQVAALDTYEIQALVEELQLYQAELEIQNDQLRSTQEELVSVRDRYRDLYDHAPAGYLTLDAEGAILEANLAAAQLLGVERERLMGKRLRTFVAPESQDALHLAWRRITADADHVSEALELLLRSGSGESRYVHVRLDGQGDAGELGWRAFCVLVDVTERKRAERELAELNAQLESLVDRRTRELRHREEELRTLLEAAPEGILTIDEDGNIRSANPAAHAMFGGRRSGLLGRVIGDLLPGLPDPASLASASQRNDDEIPGERIEVTGERDDGSTFPAYVALARIDDEELAVAIIVDISDARTLEREILDIAEQERRRISRELHDTVGQNLSGLAMLVRSHEERLGRSGEEVRAAFAEIRERLEEAVRSTRDVIHDLAPAKLDEGGLAYALEHLAEDIRDHYGIECTCDCAGTEPPLDETAKIQLLRIATEAAHNALKHAAAASLRVRLETGEAEVILSIEDDGVGISDATEGMGLGIMRHRAQVVGGGLDVLARDPRGTEVRARLPV